MENLSHFGGCLATFGILGNEWADTSAQEIYKHRLLHFASREIGKTNDHIYRYYLVQMRYFKSIEVTLANVLGGKEEAIASIPAFVHNIGAHYGILNFW